MHQVCALTCFGMGWVDHDGERVAHFQCHRRPAVTIEGCKLSHNLCPKAEPLEYKDCNVEVGGISPRIERSKSREPEGNPRGRSPPLCFSFEAAPHGSTTD
jgi:hypothetical protein